MRKRYKPVFAMLLALSLLGGATAAQASPEELAPAYRAQVDRVLDVPPDEVRRYAALAEAALQSSGALPPAPQYLLVVDRDPWVQAALLLWRSAPGAYGLVGASPVSTGRSGGADNYATPVGAFKRAGPDSRSTGVADEQGIRWWGTEGMRIDDFGWHAVPPGWGEGKATRMQLLVHSVDTEALERRLGSAQTSGTIWIPSSLNHLLDRYRVQYDLAVVHSGRTERPAWSPAPFLPHRRPAQPAPPPPPDPRRP